MNTRIAHKILDKRPTRGVGHLGRYWLALRIISARPRDLTSWEMAAAILGTLYHEYGPESTRRKLHNDGDGVYVLGRRKCNARYPRRTRNRDGSERADLDKTIPF